ncbi:MAG TPA: methyltransferase MtaB domain-containing protein [Longilinea sp.]|nr:methyltransferase MtaB domain-containing protein [Longilinea sp.]
MPSYRTLSIKNADDLVFGVSPHPIRLKNGLVIGGGKVFPELNFTLPDMLIDAGSMPEVRSQYTQMIQDATRRAAALNVPGLVVEYELLPELTLNPAWGAEIAALLHKNLVKAQEEYGFPTALRVTPNDIREFTRPPLLRHGQHVDEMFRSFELCAQAGADFLAIESTGGKEVHDDAILNGDLPVSVFALGVLGSRDIAFLWQRIVSIANQYGCTASADSACGFANTAMVLAEQHFIPRVWAAVIRVMTVARSLVAFEQGAIGPGKDCAYEGPYLKAITGCPIALEGAEAACAHFSSIGNIAKATPDLWSNESVNNVKLLAGMAPTVSVEQLIYATRLMNTSSAQGKDAAQMLRDWFVQSDADFDPQAYVLVPEVVIDLAGKIISEPTPYLRTRRAARETLAALRSAYEKKVFELSGVELRWLDKLAREADALPDDEDAFIASVLPRIDRSKVHLEEYDIKTS